MDARVFRRSPVAFPTTPAATEVRDGWQVVLSYGGEDDHDGPLLVDLSHRRRWDFQDFRLETRRPMGLPVPERSGQVGVHDPFVVNRMNRTQVAIWHLGDRNARTVGHGRTGAASGAGGCPDVGLTETTDGHCMLAIVGAHARRAGPSTATVASVLERLTPLDLFDPARVGVSEAASSNGLARALATPFLTQGPVLHVPCQVVTFGNELVAMTLARGYGETFAAAVLECGAIDGLRPGGEDAFTKAFARVTRV